MDWVDALGWFGSALLIYSLLQARILRLRVLNTVACVILIVFNALIGVWPMVAMNVVLAAINIVFIVRMLRERGDERAYAVLPVREDDAYLTHFLGVHRADIDAVLRRVRRTGPPRAAPPTSCSTATRRPASSSCATRASGVAQVELDYVTPRFRDFSPGRVRLPAVGAVPRPRLPAGAHPARDGLALLRAGRASPAQGDRYRLDLA